MLDNPTADLLLVLFLGILFGILLGGLVIRVLLSSKYIPKSELSAHYSPKAIVEEFTHQIEEFKFKIQTLHQEKSILLQQVGKDEQKLITLQEKLESQQWEAAEWHKRSINEFENLANRILEEKAKNFRSII